MHLKGLQALQLIMILLQFWIGFLSFTNPCVITERKVCAIECTGVYLFISVQIDNVSVHICQFINLIDLLDHVG